MTLDIPDNDLPESVHRIVQEAIGRHDDIEDARKEAEAAIRSLPEFPSLVDQLVTRAIGRLVNDARHARTVAIKRQAGGYGGPAKIDYQQSEAVNRVFRSMYDLAVAGTTLGALLAEQLPEAAETEERIGNGHLAVASLIRRVIPLAKAGKRVRECVPEKKLRSLWRQINGREETPKHKTNGHVNGTACVPSKPKRPVRSR